MYSRESFCWCMSSDWYHLAWLEYDTFIGIWKNCNVMFDFWQKFDLLFTLILESAFEKFTFVVEMLKIHEHFCTCILIDGKYLVYPSLSKSCLLKVAVWQDGLGCLWMAAYNICFIVWWTIHIWMEQIWPTGTWRLWGSSCASQASGL
jgi:hypothetical protein